MERGEGDPFFEGDVIFTTIDQLLSSYIGVPVSLPRRLANMPAGALVGSCVVFDEFHLREPERALTTALDLVGRLRQYSQVLLMSATFSGRGVEGIQRRYVVSKQEVLPEEISYPGRPETERRSVWSDQVLTAESVLSAYRDKSIAVCNTVDRAITYYRGLLLLAEGYAAWDVADYGTALERLREARDEMRVGFSEATLAERAGALVDRIAIHLPFLGKDAALRFLEYVDGMVEAPEVRSAAEHATLRGL